MVKFKVTPTQGCAGRYAFIWAYIYVASFITHAYRGTYAGFTQ